MPRALGLTAFAMTLMSLTTGLAAQDKPVTRPLWEGKAPHQQGDTPRDTPELIVYLPPKEKATGCGVVILPGGGYGGLAMDHEGHQIAKWFNQFGVAGFICKYRVAPYRHPVPLTDAQRALRTVRHLAPDFGVDPRRIGLMGFSAGGHLASTAGTRFDSGNPQATDPVERQGCRPDFLILCYPVITLEPPMAHSGSRNNLLGKDADPALVKSLCNDTQVTKDTPTTFLFHTNQDTGVPPENSVLFYSALRRHGVPAELHIFRDGRHGVGLAAGDPVLREWPNRLRDWVRSGGWLTATPRAAVEGKVSLNGKPVGQGWVALHPTLPASPIAVAELRNGAFRLSAQDGAVPGEHEVQVVLNHVGWNEHPDNFRGSQTLTPPGSLIVTVASGENRFDFALKP